MNKVYHADNLEILKQLEPESIDLIYIDPPFNTKKKRSLTHLKTEQSESGDSTGFQDKRFSNVEIIK